jgi:ADP-ribose pyrophosphatase YjhB (NUDIX family)
MKTHYFSSLKSSPTTDSETTNNVLDNYDWEKILPFQKNNHNSIKITVPDIEEQYSKDDLYTVETFHSKLEATIATAEQLGKTAIWITIPISRARLMEEASKSGFVFHHAEGHNATLSKWLLNDVESRIPTFATHQVGVGAVVINSVTNEILCVREKRYNYRPWKVPGGLAELGEDLDTAVIREVYEETGIKCRFLSVLGVRHSHGAQFGRSDLYFVCRLEPIPINGEGNVPKPVPQVGEIEAAAWINFDEYRDMVNSEDSEVGHPMMKQIMKIVEQSEQNDIQKTIISSVVPGRKPSPVYHAPIQK